MNFELLGAVHALVNHRQKVNKLSIEDYAEARKILNEQAESFEWVRDDIGEWDLFYTEKEKTK